MLPRNHSSVNEYNLAAPKVVHVQLPGGRKIPTKASDVDPYLLNPDPNQAF
jgi:hypothetical protein